MRINEIWISKLDSLSNFSLGFPRPSDYHFGKLKLSLLVGENGTGKTSILKFLSQVFVNEKYLTSLNASFKIQYEIDGTNNILSKESYSDNKYPLKVIVSSYSAFEPYKHKAPNKMLSEYVYLGPLGQGAIGPVASISSICIPVLETLFHSDKRKLSAIYDLMDEIGYTDFPLIQIGFTQSENFLHRHQEKIERSMNNYSFEMTEKYYNEIMCLLEKLHMFHRSLPLTKIKGRYLLNVNLLVHYPDGPEGWLKDIKSLATIPGGVNLVKSLSFKKKGELIPIQSFSSGELSLFFRFFKLIAAMADNSLVLIDEPETHLHPRWIQKYLNMIKSIFGHYNAHFIIATHSPLLAADIPNECIIGLRKNQFGNVEQYTVNEQTLGTSPQEILREVFHLENYYGDFTTYTVEKINKLIDLGKLELAEKLYEDLGDSDEKFRLFLRLREIGKKGNKHVDN